MMIQDKKYLALGLGAFIFIAGFVLASSTPVLEASLVGNDIGTSTGSIDDGDESSASVYRTFNVLDNTNGCSDSRYDNCYRAEWENLKAYADAIVQADDIDYIYEENGVKYVEEGESVDYECGEDGTYDQAVSHDTYLYYGDSFSADWDGSNNVEPTVDGSTYDELSNEGSFSIDFESPKSVELVCVAYHVTYDGQATGGWRTIDYYDEYAIAPDSDGDDVYDYNDECPNTPGSVSAGGCPDSDGDGVKDSNDDFPYDKRCVTDSDGDGVCDNKDAFPNDPNKQYDQDGDGISDSVDECPSTEGPSEFNGCPDSDGDDVPDRIDRCPDTGDEGFGLTDNGCPIKDDDSDGVGNDVDNCSGTPIEAEVDSKGCALDSDGDGVSDYKDECPNTGETPLGVDSEGCAIEDDDGDGKTNVVDQCPQTYGSPTSGCPNIWDKIINFVGLRGIL